MKIVQINYINKYMSTGRTSFELHEILKKNKHDSYLVHSVGPKIKESIQISNYFDRKIHAVLSRLLGLQGYFSINSTKKLLKKLKKISPDIVHIRNLHANYINLEILLNFLSENDIATVVTLHDSWFYTGKCTYYDAIGCDKWQKTCGNCPLLKQDNPSLFFDRTTKILEDKRKLFYKIPRLAIIGVSDYITNHAKISILSNASIIKRIYNWVDIYRFNYKKSDLREKHGLNNKIVILSIATLWGERKGIFDLFALNSIIPDNIKIVMIGNVPKSIKIPSGIIHVSEINSIDRLVEYYSVADIFLNFSKEETFGKVVAEALCCGIPVITSNRTANPELVNDSTGIVLENLSSTLILESIEKINRKGKNFYMKNCREFAIKNFDKDSRINDYINVYNDLINMKETKI